MVDIEATAWNETPPPGEQSEIIEIGIAALNLQTLEIEERERQREVEAEEDRDELRSNIAYYGWAQAGGGRY